MIDNDIQDNISTTSNAEKPCCEQPTDGSACCTHTDTDNGETCCDQPADGSACCGPEPAIVEDIAPTATVASACCGSETSIVETAPAVTEASSCCGPTEPITVAQAAGGCC
ncbi:hypothetical protein JYT44_01065 [Caldithrix abyssi]|nr:hypothetical protein [Caldithrix abyssi]